MQRKKKIIFTALVTIIVLSTYFVTASAYKGFPFNKETFYPTPPGSGKLDYHFIKNLTESLSNVVFKYPKGRAFGTEGERYAALLYFTILNNCFVPKPKAYNYLYEIKKPPN